MTQVLLEDISAGRFTEATIRRMYELVDRAKTDERFQKIIYSIVNSNLPGQWKQYRREIETVFNWFKGRHDYRRDPYSVELLQDVWATMDRKRFDCDDATIFLCAACEILGAPCRMVTVSTHANKEPSHVYPEAYVGGEWVALDATVPYSTVGWTPSEGITDRKVWKRQDVGLSGDDEILVEGLGRMRDESMPNGWTRDGYAHRARRRADQSYDGMVRWEGGFARDFFEEPPPEGTTSRGGKTWAPGEPGEAFVRRDVPGLPEKLIRSVADDVQTEAPGGYEYGADTKYPIVSHATPRERIMLRKDRLPAVLDPGVWTGRIPDADRLEVSNVYYDYTLPRPAPRKEEYLVDLAGLGSTVDEITAIALNLVKSGQFPSVEQATALAMKMYQERLAAKEAEKRAKEEAARIAAASRPVSTAAVAGGIGVGTLALLGIAAVVMMGTGKKRNPCGSTR